MIKEIKTITNDYLQNRINKVMFVEYCRKLYEQSLQSEEYSIRLDLIIAIPFIHEFAYCEYTESELRAQVVFFQELLDGKQKYHDSNFFKLPVPKDSDKTMSALYRKFPNIELIDLYDIFGARGVLCGCEYFGE